MDDDHATDEITGWAPLTPKAFRRLSEYSCTDPTGTTIGKVWRCNQNSRTRLDVPKGATGSDWWVKWYARHPESDDHVLIKSRKALSFEIPEDLK